MKTPAPRTPYLARHDAHLGPWYHHPWPWFLMLGPAIVVVAALATAVIAVKTADVIVSDDAGPRPARVQDASR
jgi:hypothetical protein